MSRVDGRIQSRWVLLTRALVLPPSGTRPTEGARRCRSRPPDGRSDRRTSGDLEERIGTSPGGSAASLPMPSTFSTHSRPTSRCLTSRVGSSRSIRPGASSPSTMMECRNGRASGRTISRVCQQAEGEHAEEAQRTLSGLRAVLEGRLAGVSPRIPLSFAHRTAVVSAPCLTAETTLGWYRHGSFRDHRAKAR